MAARLSVELLGVTLEIEAERACLLDYTHAFLDAYGDGGPRRTPGGPRVRVRAQSGELPPGRGRRVQVHRSKHPYWNFSGTLIGERPRTVRWDGRQVSAAVEARGAAATLVVGPECPPAVAGESLFHLLRAVALYVRPGTAGNLLHASAVEFGGRAVLFMGNVSAGKTTLLTEATVAHAARPLSNDRVLVTDSTVPFATSWPSYSSFCEGTLLAYPPLRDAAESYERGELPYRTQTWPGPLSHVYVKDRKRAYPMRWFTDVVGVRFSPGAPLGALVIARLDPGVPGWALERLDLRRREVRETVERLLHRNCFDGFEPSFCPWHGLALPAGAPPLERMVSRMCGAEVPVLRLSLPPSDIRRLGELFDTIKSGDQWG